MRTYRQLAMGLLALLLCIALPSCSDDDGPSEEEQMQGMIQLLNLKMCLCELDDEGEPVEAIFGKPYNASAPSERVYYTKDVATAKKRFALLFNDSTPCSADGNTYTLTNNQGTATFTPGNGEKGLLATATFNVPGLKGFITKIYFIDLNKKATNSETDRSQFEPGTLATYDNNYLITVGKWEKIAEDERLLIAPYIIYGYESWIILTQNNASMYGIHNKPIVEIMENYTESEYKKFCEQLCSLVGNGRWRNYGQYTTGDYMIVDKYTKWDKKSFFIQVSYRGYFASSVWWNSYKEEVEYLLIDPERYAERTKLYKVEGNTIPEALEQAIPLAYNIFEANQIDLSILEKEPEEDKNHQGGITWEEENLPEVNL